VPPTEVNIERVDWPTFWRRFHWKPGEHVLIYGPTGRGKTVLAGQLLAKRRFVVALDFKGDDPGLSRWGWERVDSWPIPDERNRLAGRVVTRGGQRVRVVDPIRVRLSPALISDREQELAAGTFEQCLQDIFRIGKWTVYIDELIIAVERREYDLEQLVTKLMTMARSRDATMVNSTQSLRGIPARAYDQPTHFFMLPPRDWYGIERLEEVTGLGRGLRDQLSVMPRHDFLYASHDKFMISRAPKPEDLPAAVVNPTGVGAAGASANGQQSPRRGDEPPDRGAGRIKKAMWGG
jgi:hypothetical protein